MSSIFITAAKIYGLAYGLAHSVDSYTVTKLALRLKRFNCEFLVRPSIGLSEFADTILTNSNYIATNLENFDAMQIQRFLDKIAPLYPHLEVLNRKNELDGKILLLLYPYSISFQLDGNILILIIHVVSLFKMQLIAL